LIRTNDEDGLLPSLGVMGLLPNILLKRSTFLSFSCLGLVRLKLQSRGRRSGVLAYEVLANGSNGEPFPTPVFMGKKATNNNNRFIQS
jgi:hypothetical protein